MFGVLLVTLLLTIGLVGSNMDIILKQGVTFQVRTEITETPGIAESFSNPNEFEKFIQSKISSRGRCYKASVRRDFLLENLNIRSSKQVIFDDY